MRRTRSVLFVIAEDWFFVSHFLPAARRIADSGYEVGVICRVTERRLREMIENSGIRVIESASFRERTGVTGLPRQIHRLYALMRREKPEIVHLISLRMVVIGGVAAVLARVPLRVLALTGLGLLGAARSVAARVAMRAVRIVLQHVLGGPRTVYLFENRDDPLRLGLDLRRSKLIVVGGAGIDPLRETVQPLPSGTTLRVAVVARMIYTKGITVAVRAVDEARRAGADTELTLVGQPDPGNPRSLTEEDLRELERTPGVRWVGPAHDIAAVWRDHHVACVPSLGGEGLPRALLEAAAAGRPIVTTQTPGCATFVRDGIEGFLVPPGDVSSLAEALVGLSRQRALVETMGHAARMRVLDGFTVESVADAILSAYESGAASHRSSDGGQRHNRSAPQRR